MGAPPVAIPSHISVKAKTPKGITKGEAEEMLEKENPIHFPLGTSGESEDHTEGPRRLFAYFLVGEKVGPRREVMLPVIIYSLQHT